MMNGAIWRAVSKSITALIFSIGPFHWCQRRKPNLILALFMCFHPSPDVRSALAEQETEFSLVLHKPGVYVTPSGVSEPITRIIPVRPRSGLRSNGDGISIRGLLKLVQDGEQTLGDITPYNFTLSAGGTLAIGSLSGKGKRPGKMLYLPYDETREIVGEYARIGGWLRAASALTTLRRCIQKTQSARGTGSPRTKIDLDKIIAHWPSPGRLDRCLRGTMYRAKLIAAAWGLTPSWEDVAKALMISRRIGKAAVIAAARCVRGQGVTTYRVARQLLITSRISHLSRCIDDGVEVLVPRKASAAIHGVEIHEGLQLSKSKRGWCYVPARLVSSGGRSYHCLTTDWGTLEGSQRESVKEALHQWGVQADRDQLYAEYAPKGVSVLVWRQDVHDAGACWPGIEAFAQIHGMESRAFVPLSALLPHVDNPHVARAIDLAIHRANTQIRRSA